MCGGTASEAFTSGALGVLAQIHRVAVLATDTGVPLLPASSSHTCRVPVFIPPLDIDAAMAAIPVLSNLQARVDSAELDRNQEKLWEVLRFRLALKLRSSMPLGDLDSQIKVASETSDLTQALIACGELCTFQLTPPQPETRMR